MKILLTGASGSVGGEVLAHCLNHAQISRVVAFVRRDLPPDVSGHPKLESVVMKDFSVWPEEILKSHTDAAAMIWNIGSYSGDRGADLEYPLAFIESMGSVLQKYPTHSQFRYVQLSGKFVRQDQEKRLWFLEKPRKLKGLLETKALEYANSHAAIWKTFIVKPGGIVTKNMPAPGAIQATFSTLLGDNWCIRIEELAAFMTYLAVDGGEEESITETARMVKKRRELLKLHESGSTN